MKTVRVALDVPVQQLFDYVDESDACTAGDRVLVPFGRRQAVGVVLETSTTSALPRERLKSISRVLRDAARLSADDLKLLRFAADYYQHPLGQVVLAALPQRLKRVREPRRKVAEERSDARASPESQPAGAPALALTPTQAHAAAAIRESLGAFRPLLLWGVTGSGKTAVYLDAAEAA